MADDATPAGDYLAPPTREPDKPPAPLPDPREHSEFLQRLHRGEELATEPQEPQTGQQEPPGRLTPDELLDRLAEPELDPEREAALAELEQEREMWENVASGEPVKRLVADEEAHVTALMEAAERHPGIATQAFADVAEPLLEQLAEAHGEDYAYAAQTVEHLYEALGGAERYEIPDEAAAYGGVFGRGEVRQTDDGRLELVPDPDARVNRFGL